jgi:hypothetical protein
MMKNPARAAVKRDAEESWAKANGGDRRFKIKKESDDTHCASGPRASELNDMLGSAEPLPVTRAMRANS